MVMADNIYGRQRKLKYKVIGEWLCLWIQIPAWILYRKSSAVRLSCSLQTDAENAENGFILAEVLLALFAVCICVWIVYAWILALFQARTIHISPQLDTRWYA